MAGTPDGGRKAAAKNKMLYGESFYRIIGKRGGRLSRGGGFASNPELARTAGIKGGKASRRTSKKIQMEAAIAEQETAVPSRFDKLKALFQ